MFLCVLMSPPAAAAGLIPWTPVTPVVDGQCDTGGEYAEAVRLGGILLYRPAEDEQPVRVFITVTSATLYVCIWRMPVGTGR